MVPFRGPPLRSFSDEVPLTLHCECLPEEPGICDYGVQGPVKSKKNC